MEKKVIEFNKNLRAQKKVDFHAGDVIKVHLRIKEGGKERVQVFEGLVIAIKGRQSSSPTLTVRKVTHGVGVEMIVPILSKNVQKIELIKSAKVRRAKLYYVRDLTAKQSRMKYKDIKEFSKAEENVKITENTDATEGSEAADEKLSEEEIKEAEKEMANDDKEAKGEEKKETEEKPETKVEKEDEPKKTEK